MTNISTHTQCYCLLLAGLLTLSGCKSESVKPQTPQQAAPQTGGTHAVSGSNSMFGSMMDSYSEDDSDESFELYFHDSHGMRFFVDNRGKDRLESGVEALISQTLKNSAMRLQNQVSRKKVNIAIEVSGDEDYRDPIITAAEQFILSQRRYSLQSQDSDMKNVVSKILRRELDPFYESNENSDITAQASDVILYIRYKSEPNQLRFKASLLSKSGAVLGITSTKLSLNEGSSTQSKWLNVTVPFADGNGSQVFQVQRKPVTEAQLYNRGNHLHSANNMTFDQANSYCVNQGSSITQPYAFEHARRSKKIQRPEGNVSEELIAPFDEDQYDFYQEEDKLVVDEESDTLGVIIFNWTNETYYAASSAYRSQKMTFRCMKN